jgi:hypothetical protein
MRDVEPQVQRQRNQGKDPAENACEDDDRQQQAEASYTICLCNPVEDAIYLLKYLV